MKVIGYGICGNGEAGRYMEATLKEFARLCDKVIILGNCISHNEKKLIAKYGFTLFEDNREWGKLQWKIKEEFLQKQVMIYASEGDMMVCMDMDETMPQVTKEWILEAPLDAYQLFVIDLWNDEQHYKPEWCFWNVRIWRWNGNIKFKQTPVHCGLAPQWAYHYHRFAPFLLLHYGLMKREDRQKKIARYERYDPSATHMDRRYYNALSSDTDKPFSFDELAKQIAHEVATYQQNKPRVIMEKKPIRYAYIKNQHGVTLDIPERDLAMTLKRPGFSFVGWADDAQKDMEEMFGGAEPELGTDKLKKPLLPSTDELKQQEEKAEKERQHLQDQQQPQNPHLDRVGTRVREKPVAGDTTVTTKPLATDTNVATKPVAKVAVKKVVAKKK